MAEIMVKAKEKIVIETSIYNGKDYIGIRKFFLADDGNWYPTKKGITVSKETMHLIIEAITEL